MKLINIKKAAMFVALIVILIIVQGCVTSYNFGNIGMMEPNKNSSLQEFYIDNYKMKIRVLPVTEDREFMYSISLLNKSDRTPLKDVKSTMDIKKYPTKEQKTHFRHRHGMDKIVSDLTPIIDSVSIDYDYKYKFNSKGKYELTIRLTQIEGKELEKEILVSFDQEVK